MSWRSVRKFSYVRRSRSEVAGSGTAAGRGSTHPLTDFPVAAYILAAVFKHVIATVGRHESWARLLHAGTFVFVGQRSVPSLTALTGFGIGSIDRESAGAPQGARVGHDRTVLALANMLGSAARLAQLPDTAILVISIVVALLVDQRHSAALSCSTMDSTSKPRPTARSGIRRDGRSSRRPR